MNIQEQKKYKEECAMCNAGYLHGEGTPPHPYPISENKWCDKCGTKIGEESKLYQEIFPLPEINGWEERFWELQKKYNLLLDNENYDDLRKFAKEYEVFHSQEIKKQYEKELPDLEEGYEWSTCPKCDGLGYYQIDIH